MKNRVLQRHMLENELLEPRLCLSAIGFARQTIEYDPGGRPGMTTSDLDGDGDLDFIAGSVFWRPNVDGQGTFGPPRLVSNQTNEAGQLLAGDLDNDGDNDVVTSSSDDAELAWFENVDGKGSFGTKRLIAPIDSRVVFLDGADLDGDGDFDLLLGSSSTDGSTLEWFENKGGERFQRKIVSREAREGIIVDLDHDGDLDLVAGSSWFENTGQGDFAQAEGLIPGRGHRVIADVDNDGRLDLLSEELRYRATDTPGKFEQQAGSIDEPRDRADVYAGDVDGDGDLDAIVVDTYYESSFVEWYELTDDGTYRKRERLFQGKAVGEIVIGDLNGDQSDDLLIYSWSDHTFWFSYQDELGRFGSQIGLGKPNLITMSSTLADVDGDELPDFVDTQGECDTETGCTHTIGIRRRFAGEVAYGPREVIGIVGDLAHDTRIWAADVDRDGDLDLLLISGVMVWYENLGDGQFQGRQSVNLGRSTDLIQSDDDFVIATSIGDHVLFWTYDAVQQTFVSETVIEDPEVKSRDDLAIGDLDGDGDLDIVVVEASFPGPSRFVWYEQLDGRSYSPARELATVVEPHARIHHAGDFDGDGDDDLVVGTFEQTAWIESLGAGQFGDVQTIIPGALGVRPHDVDQDGDLDLIGDTLMGLVWYENLADDSGFSTRRLIDVTPGNRYVVSDLDEDGDLDVLKSGGGLWWFENRFLGDANGDGVFDSSDLVSAFKAGKYEDDIPGNSSYSEGDWNSDGDFTSLDLVFAFQSGAFGAGSVAGGIAAAIDFLFSRDDESRSNATPAFHPD